MNDVAAHLLSSATLVVHFEDPEEMQKAALLLMRCHPHHFAVLPDFSFGLCVSDRAASCIERAVLDGKIKLT